jgi:hypothetical protein
MFVFYSFLTIFCFSQFAGCGSRSVKRLQKQAGLKSHRIHMKDLGTDYRDLVDGKYDYFSTKSAVKKLTKAEPLKQKYRTFRLKKI